MFYAAAPELFALAGAAANYAHLDLCAPIQILDWHIFHF
jgi:hypothetical protein